MRICLHHSSVPYSAAPAPVTEAEVLEAQALWANQIAAISKVHADKAYSNLTLSLTPTLTL